MKLNRKRRPLAKQYEQFFVPVYFIPMSVGNDLRQPDLRPIMNGVVSGGAAEVPVETWSERNAKLARGVKRD